MEEGELTNLLHSANAGDRAASDRLLQLIYPDLKRLAHSNLWRNGGSDELNTTAVVHESFMRFMRRNALMPEDRGHFFAYVGKVMRSVIIDSVRERLAEKRGGGECRVTLTTSMGDEVMGDERLLAVNAAMASLEKIAPDLHQLVEMRYFAGLSVIEISEIRGTSTRTVQREWNKARAFLRKLMDEE